ncbi:MAG: DUF4440 domain-containing protein [Thioalkalivibrio sp.]|nr:MAG: DUF4440 domain-containing protein [Thioalkalivibrio sp.]
MYESFYGLKADPFRLSSDANFRFDHRSYKRAKASVQYALHRAEGFVMITGRPGTGKTTLVNDLTASLSRREVIVGSLVSTQLEADDLLRMTAHAFGLNAQAPQKSQILMRLMEYLAQQHRQGLRTLLIIDEAQDLAPSALEELRLLTNLQHGGHPLLQIVLIGQENLRVLVRRPELEQVHQRLIAAWHLEPLGPEETIGYVRHRLERAGWSGDPSFEPGVMPIVYQFSEGVPRRVNLICSRLLLYGFIGDSHTITEEDGRAVAQELKDEELTRPVDDRKDAWPLPEEGQLSAESTPPHASGGEKGTRKASDGEAKKTAWSEIDRGLYRAGGTEAAGQGPVDAPTEEQAHAEEEVRPASEQAPEEVPKAQAQAAEELPKRPASSEQGMTQDADTAAGGNPTAPAAPDASVDPHRPRVDAAAEPSLWRTGGVAVPLSSESGEVHIAAERDWDRPGAHPRDVPPEFVDAAESRGSAVGRVILVFVLLLAIGVTAFLLMRPSEEIGGAEPPGAEQIPAPRAPEPSTPDVGDQEVAPPALDLLAETLPEVAESALDEPGLGPLEELEPETTPETDAREPSLDAVPRPVPLEIETVEAAPAQAEPDAVAEETVPDLATVSPDIPVAPDSTAPIETDPVPERPDSREPASEADVAVAPAPAETQPLAALPVPAGPPDSQSRLAGPEPLPPASATESTSAPSSEAPPPTLDPAPPATVAPEPRPQPPAGRVAMAPPPEPEPAGPDPRVLAEQGIRALLNSYSNAFERGDINAYLGSLSENPSENANQGRDWFRQSYSQLFEQTDSRSLQIQVEDIRPDGDAWTVSARFEMQVEYPGRPPTSAVGPISYRAVQQGGEWRLDRVEY